MIPERLAFLDPGHLWTALLLMWLLLFLVLMWVHIRIRRTGRRCPRCLRPWDARIERSWGDLERQARIERRRTHRA